MINTFKSSTELWQYININKTYYNKVYKDIHAPDSGICKYLINKTYITNSNVRQCLMCHCGCFENVIHPLDSIIAHNILPFTHTKLYIRSRNLNTKITVIK